MIKIAENKTRKRLRIAQCVFYLLQIFFCTFTFIRFPDPENEGRYIYKTLLDIFGMFGNTFSDSEGGAKLVATIPFLLILAVIPIVGFFFCALDKERNLKNIVSIFCCLFGVFAIITFIPMNMMDFGAVFSLINYLIISFITSVAMMARLTDK